MIWYLITETPYLFAIAQIGRCIVPTDIKNADNKHLIYQSRDLPNQPPTLTTQVNKIPVGVNIPAISIYRLIVQLGLSSEY